VNDGEAKCKRSENGYDKYDEPFDKMTPRALRACDGWHCIQ
jgi:hypothetical protein